MFDWSTVSLVLEEHQLTCQAAIDNQRFPIVQFGKDSSSAIHSRLSSLQSFDSSLTRSDSPNVFATVERTSTPKIPPGFDIMHEDPQASNQKKPTEQQVLPKRGGFKASHAPTIPVAPQVVAVPRSSLPKSNVAGTDLIGEREILERIGESSNAMASVVSDDHYTGKAESSRIETASKRIQEEEHHASTSLPDPSSPQTTTERQNQEEPPLKENKKAQIPSAAKTRSVPSEKILVSSGQEPTQTFSIAEVASITSSDSRPITPDPVEAKRPITLRLTTEMINRAQKSDAAVSGSSSAEASSALPSQFQVRRTSRQTSISASQPSTPAISDHFLSRDVSRAGSPPPSIIGSASARGKTKNQMKKERREKIKKPTETNESETFTAPPSPPSQSIAPIVARQKKQKKAKTSPAEHSVHEPKIVKSKVDDISPPPSENEPKKGSKKVDSLPPSPNKKMTEKDSVETSSSLQGDEQPKRITEQNRQPYTIRDFYTEALKMQAGSGPSGVDIQGLLNARVSPMSKLLSDMISHGDLRKDHPWFNPPPFNSATYKLPPDQRKGQDYLDGNGYSNNDAFGYVYLPQKEKRALFNGHAVSVADSGDRKNDLLRRCLITPNGWVLRHLSAEESERVLDLEERRGLYIEEHGEVGMMNGLGILEQDDFINLGGGFDELARFGDRHGVCWVVGESGNDQHQAETAGLEDEYDLDGLADEADMLGGGVSDETDEDLAGDVMAPGSMPSTWDPTFPLSSTDLSANTIPSIQGQYGRNVNLRAIDMDALQRRSQEKQKEADSSRKDAEKAEKALGKKVRDYTRWRDSILKAVEA